MAKLSLEHQILTIHSFGVPFEILELKYVHKRRSGLINMETCSYKSLIAIVFVVDKSGSYMMIQ